MGLICPSPQYHDRTQRPGALLAVAALAIRLFCSSVLSEVTMNDSNQETAGYSLDVGGKEYKFEVTRDGDARCECHTDAVRVMQHEDLNMGVKALLLRDEKADNRLRNIESEFTADIKLPERVTKLIWEGWDEIDLKNSDTQKMTPAKKAREDELDAALLPIVKETFGV